MKKITFAAVIILGLAGAGVGAATMWPQSRSEITTQDLGQLQTATFAVENMTCATCPITVRQAMQGVGGVHDVTIDFEARTATARFDPAQTKAEAIAAASTEAGYPALAQSIAADL